MSSTRTVLSAALAFAAAGFADPATARDDTHKPFFSLHLGAGKHYQRYTLNWETAPVWTHRFDGGSRVDLSLEFGVSHWRASRGREPDSAWQASAIPLFRWWPNERFYVEGGIGPTLLSTTKLAGKRISSAYQFGDHLGAGFALTPSQRIGVRYSHFSNAGIKRPNPGLDVLQATYSLQF